ncbi:hypothetical protein [Xenorhabdus bovienii]
MDKLYRNDIFAVSTARQFTLLPLLVDVQACLTSQAELILPLYPTE